jgi:hypothetical protein
MPNLCHTEFLRVLCKLQFYSSPFTDVSCYDEEKEEGRQKLQNQNICLHPVFHHCIFGESSLYYVFFIRVSTQILCIATFKSNRGRQDFTHKINTQKHSMNSKVVHF